MKWSDILPEPVMLAADALTTRAAHERDHGRTIFPPQDDIFRALSITTPDKLKVCVIGQDPYHGPKQANGLAFSVSPSVNEPPSLVNIFKELRDDLGFQWPRNGDLTPWAEQGVLLLNTSLTVEAKKPNSHADWGWQAFTGEVLKQAVLLPQPIVFMLWGAYAANLAANLDVPPQAWSNKLRIISTHPSPYSADKRTAKAQAFLGSRPFSTANAFLEKNGVAPVDWALPVG